MNTIFNFISDCLPPSWLAAKAGRSHLRCSLTRHSVAAAEMEGVSDLFYNILFRYASHAATTFARAVRGYATHWCSLRGRPPTTHVLQKANILYGPRDNFLKRMPMSIYSDIIYWHTETVYQILKPFRYTKNAQ